MAATSKKQHAMRRLSISIGVVLLSSVSAFSPNSWDGRISSALTSTLSENNDVMVDTTVVGVEQETHLLVANVEVPAVPLPNVALPSTDSEKKKNSMEEINKKDKTSMDLSKKVCCLVVVCRRLAATCNASSSTQLLD